MNQEYIIESEIIDMLIEDDKLLQENLQDDIEDLYRYKSLKRRWLDAMNQNPEDQRAYQKEIKRIAEDPEYFKFADGETLWRMHNEKDDELNESEKLDLLRYVRFNCMLVCRYVCKSY